MATFSTSEIFTCSGLMKVILDPLMVLKNDTMLIIPSVAVTSPTECFTILLPQNLTRTKSPGKMHWLMLIFYHCYLIRGLSSFSNCLAIASSSSFSDDLSSGSSCFLCFGLVLFTLSLDCGCSTTGRVCEDQAFCFFLLLAVDTLGRALKWGLILEASPISLL